MKVFHMKFWVLKRSPKNILLLLLLFIEKDFILLKAFLCLQTLIQPPFPNSFSLHIDLLQQYLLGFSIVTGTNSNTQPMYTTMVEISSVSSSYIFAKSPKPHLYGGMPVPHGYQSLSGTFSSASSSPWTYPTSSNSGIISGTSLMNATQSTPIHLNTPRIEE